MKKSLGSLIILLTIFSCSVESPLKKATNITGEWVLVKMHGQIPNSETTGTDMEWQESYNLEEDGTFKKTRIRNNDTTIVTGTYKLTEEGYTIHEEQVNTFVEFFHDSENQIIENCTSDLVEYLYVTANIRMISTAEACDRPGLEYEQEK